MYFTIGGHPAFRFQKADEKKTDYKLRFPDKKALGYILVDLSECVADPWHSVQAGAGRWILRFE